jgi:hypothetical protein
VGARRWDKRGSGPWERTVQSPLRVPTPAWGSGWSNARAIGWRRVGGRRARVVTFFDAGLPGWFELALDPQTARPLELRMTATAHFMHHRYLEFNTPRRIRPPVAR